MRFLPLLPFLLTLSGLAQQAVQLPRLGSPPPAPEPTSPPARTVSDTRAGLSFDLPAGWEFSREDGQLSTFALDARSAGTRARLQEVANLAFNPYPQSTFEGALFYVSSTPRLTAQACAAEAATPLPRRQETTTIDGVTFQHGYGELEQDCVVSRDEIYTTLRAGSCLRFDLVIHTACGASSGFRDMTAAQLQSVNQRMESILQSVHFDQRTPQEPHRPVR